MPPKKSQSHVSPAEVVDKNDDGLQLPVGLSEMQFHSIINTESAQSAAEAVVESILDHVFDQFHEHVVNQAAKPFIARRCKEMLQNMVETTFIGHDVGEPNVSVDPSWNAGEEPVPCSAESWARGSIPVRPEPRNRTKRLSKAQLRRLEKSSFQSTFSENSIAPQEKVQHHVSWASSITEGSVLEDRLDAGSPAVIAFVESILALGVEESVSIKMQPSEESLAGTPHSPTFDSGVDHLNNTHDYVNNVADGQHGSNLIPLNHCGDSMQSTTGSHETKSLPLDVHDRIIDTVTTIVERRNARERKALQEVKAKTGAARIAYNRTTGGAVPVFGVNPERLPRNRVVPIVKIETKNIKSIKRKSMVASK